MGDNKEYPKILFFSSVHCAPCKPVEEMLKRINISMFGKKLYIEKIDIESNSRLTQEHKITALEFFGKARNYYNAALINIRKLANAGKDTERIKANLKKVVEDDIASTGAMTVLLNRLLEDEYEVTLKGTPKNISPLR